MKSTTYGSGQGRRQQKRDNIQARGIEVLSFLAGLGVGLVDIISIGLGLSGVIACSQSIKQRRKNRHLEAKLEWALLEVEKTNDKTCAKSRELGFGDGYVQGYREASLSKLREDGLVILNRGDCENIKDSARDALGQRSSNEYCDAVMEGALHFAKYIEDDD